MTAATKLAGAVLSAFLLAGTAAEASPADQNKTPTGQQVDKKNAPQPECRQKQDLTPAEKRAILRGADLGVCKDGGEKGQVTAEKKKPVITPAPKP